MVGIAMTLSVAMLVTWAWLYNNPAVAVRIIPSAVLRYIEGVGAAPAFMFCVAVAWGRASLPRQRLAARVALVVGVLYFLHGGAWMLQTTPAAAMSQDNLDTQVLQSQDYSCVPAACATALTRMGFPTSEAEMALLTETRRGNGATVIRALDGLNRRLESSGVRAQLNAVPIDELHNIELPALTTLQYEKSRTHMVVILRVDWRGILISDPTEGVVWETADTIRNYYSGDVIAFERRPVAMR